MDHIGIDVHKRESQIREGDAKTKRIKNVSESPSPRPQALFRPDWRLAAPAIRNKPRKSWPAASQRSSLTEPPGMPGRFSYADPETRTLPPPQRVLMLPPTRASQCKGHGLTFPALDKQLDSYLHLPHFSTETVR